jgi:hypothetical protein
VGDANEDCGEDERRHAVVAREDPAGEIDEAEPICRKYGEDHGDADDDVDERMGSEPSVQVASTRFYLMDLGWSEKLEGMILTVAPSQLKLVVVEIHHRSGQQCVVDRGFTGPW